MLEYLWSPFVKGERIRDGHYTLLEPPQLSLRTFGLPCGSQENHDCQDCIHCDDPWDCPGQEAYHE